MLTNQGLKFATKLNLLAKKNTFLFGLRLLYNYNRTMTKGFQQQIYEFLMESQYFPAEQLRRQQLHQLELLVRFTRREVPYYQVRLACLFDANDQFRYSHWQDVPILSRDDLLNHGGDMFAQQIPDGHGQTADHVGSGTTGKTVTTRHNALIGQVSQATFYRALSWHNINYAKTLFSWFGAEETVDRWPDGTTGRRWGPQWEAHTKHGNFCRLSRLDTVEQAVDFMLRHRPSYVTGRPNAMLELALETERRGLQIGLDAILGFGAQVTDATSEECSRIFGAKVIDRYASKEVYDIAHQCPSSTNLHISAEAMLLEVLDERDEPCPPGVPGRVIVTPFYNTVQPLIRYDLGDVVTLGEACSCGRTLPIITALHGRTIHLFRKPDGQRFSLRLPADLQKKIGAREWQVAQVAFEEIEIRYIKIAEGTAPAFEAIAEVIRNQMTPKTRVVFTPSAQLPQTPSGKVLEMVCELPQDAGQTPT